jgi:hypothetical protein
LSQGGTPGRPTVAKEVQHLIRRMSQANPTWGSKLATTSSVFVTFGEEGRRSPNAVYYKDYDPCTTNVCTKPSLNNS